MTMPQIQEEALAMSASTAFVFDGIPESAYWIYLEIKQAISEGREPDREKFVFTLSADYENESWQHIVDCIEEYARTLVVSYRRILKYAKEGMAHCAIEGTLESDVYAIDMQSMVDLGAEIEENRVEGNAEPLKPKF